MQLQHMCIVYQEQQGIENHSIQREDSLQWSSQSDNSETKGEGPIANVNLLRRSSRNIVCSHRNCPCGMRLVYMCDGGCRVEACEI